MQKPSHLLLALLAVVGSSDAPLDVNLRQVEPAANRGPPH